MKVASLAVMCRAAAVTSRRTKIAGIARSTGAEATVRASPGNGVVVLGLDGGQVTVDVAPRWDEVGFA